MGPDQSEITGPGITGPGITGPGITGPGSDGTPGPLAAGSATPATGPAPGADPGDEIPEEADPASTGGPAPPRRRYRWLVEWGVIVVIAVVVALLLRAFVFQTFYIPSTSMYPTLKAGDRIVVYKLDHTDLHPGEIVVFRRPPAEHCGGAVVPDLVKRVIGLPGQTIESRNDEIYINGKVLPEPWLPRPTAHSTPRTEPFGPVEIPEGDYFMMGDNRMDSCDSRTWGPLPASYVVGKVVLRIWPLDRIGTF